MSESMIVGSMIAVILLSVGGMLIANFFYVYRAFVYDFSEGVACLIAVLSGYMLYILAKIGGSSLQEVLVSTALKDLVNVIGWQEVWIVTAMLGVFSGWIYGRLIRGDDFQSFRWVLLLLALTHGVLADLSLAISGAEGAEFSKKLVPSATFVLGLMLTLVRYLPGRTRGHVVQHSGQLNDLEVDEGELEPSRRSTRDPRFMGTPKQDAYREEVFLKEPDDE